MAMKSIQPITFTGYSRDEPPINEKYLYIKSPSLENLPIRVDLRPWAREIEDQNATGSCVANSLVSMMELFLEKKGISTNLSRLFLYYTARYLKNRQDHDEGTNMDDGLKALSIWGVPSESSWAFDLPSVNKEPNETSFIEGKRLKYIRYESILDIEGIKDALVKGLSVQIAILGYTKLMNLSKNIDNHPKEYLPTDNDKRKATFAHAMLIVGYDEERKYFIVENSWSTWRGDNGYVGLSYDVIKKDLLAAKVITDIKFEDHSKLTLMKYEWLKKINTLKSKIFRSSPVKYGIDFFRNTSIF